MIGTDNFFKRRVLKAKEKAIFYKELHGLLNAGVDLYSAVDMIYNQNQKNGPFRQFIKNILDGISSGSPLSECLGKGRNIKFEYVTISVGEQTGTLIKCLKNLADFYSRNIEQRKKIISALSYPILVLVFAFIAVVFMLSVIVPMFESVYKGFNNELPRLTQIVIELADYSWVLILLFLLLLGSIYLIIKFSKSSPTINKYLYKILFRVPMVGSLVYKAISVKLFLLLDTLIKSKVPLYEAVGMLEGAFGNFTVVEVLKTIRTQLIRGVSLHNAMEGSNFFDLKTISLIKISEESNQLDVAFENLNKQFSSDIEHSTTILNSLLEPLLIIVVGGVVGLILVAMYLPIFNIGGVMG